MTSTRRPDPVRGLARIRRESSVVAALVAAPAVVGLALARRSTRLSRGGGRTFVFGFGALVASMVLLAASYPAVRAVTRYRAAVGVDGAPAWASFRLRGRLPGRSRRPGSSSRTREAERVGASGRSRRTEWKPPKTRRDD
ncbi:hypothetical protein ACFO0N_17280 [Halobium salinum]|uniref:Uncharacterized protein n=1 Tax=Halobium salinum TaxID=1364940 RepID=A0ABD5PFY8_9EURY|nr:hypothetical protein [Halobium salinum]